MELHKIRKRINKLLDRYNGTDDPTVKREVEMLLEKERVKLEKWKLDNLAGIND
jgi:hypothetical protein